MNIFTSAAARTGHPARTRWAVVFSLALFALNAYICRELFTAEFVHNQLSNEGIFAAIGRFFKEHPFDYRWFPWFNTGMAIENAYQPLLPALAAITGAITGWPAPRALHAVLAFAYCCSPVTLFWLAWDWSESFSLSLPAALAFSLVSPAEILIRDVRIDAGGHWGPLRLFNLVWYGESPHTVALAILPLAWLFLRRALIRGGVWNFVLAGLMSGIVALTNAFGAFGVALGAVSLMLTLGGGLRKIILIGVGAWCWISPWLPPSLIDWIRRSSWTGTGFFQATPRAFIAIAATIATLVLTWLFTRPLKGTFQRFAVLLSLWMCTIPLGYFWLGLTIVPQSGRYQPELDMAVCLLFGCAFAWLWQRIHKAAQLALVVVLLAVGIRQTKIYRHFARKLVRPIDITKTIGYKVSTWIDHNLPGQRTLVSGDPEFIFNLFSDNPQMSSGHEPTAPNWMQRVAVFTIYTGMNAGDRDAEYSIFWLKAFGNQAIYVPGPASREFYHPIAHPHKFDGILPVLWHDEDDTIFGVPQRSGSFAHVIPQEAIVTRQPVHGLDIEPARAYVAALDDITLPLANLRWLSPSHAAIETSLRPGQVVSVQETYMPGWRASVAGHDVPVRGDKLGLIVVDPGCNGPCKIDLAFGVTAEAWFCRILSAVITLIALALVLTVWRFRRLVITLPSETTF